MMSRILSTSPRTGIWGLLLALGIFCATDLFQIVGAEDAINAIVPDGATWVRIAGGLLGVVGAWGLGHDARDNAVTSEQAKAK